MRNCETECPLYISDVSNVDVTTPVRHLMYLINNHISHYYTHITLRAILNKSSSIKRWY